MVSWISVNWHFFLYTKWPFDPDMFLEAEIMINPQNEGLNLLHGISMHI
jgi:hypothetical protein